MFTVKDSSQSKLVGLAEPERIGGEWADLAGFVDKTKGLSSTSAVPLDVTVDAFATGLLLAFVATDQSGVNDLVRRIGMSMS